MFRLFCLVAFIAINPLLINAQAPVVIGKPYGVIDAKEKIYFAKNGQILAVKVDKREVTIQKLNAIELSQIKITTYDDFPKGFQIESIIEFGDRYYVFYSLYEDEQEKLICREIDFDNGAFKDKGNVVITVDQKITGTLVKSGFSAHVEDKFDFFFSYDRSSMVIQYRVKPIKRNDDKSYDVIGMHVYGKDLKQKWGNKITMPYTEKKMDNLDYAVDSKGNVYIVTRVYNDDSTDKKKRGEEKANYHLEILKIIPDAKETTPISLEVDERLLTTIWMYENSKGEMVCVGYYSKNKKMENTDGLVSFKLTTDGKITAQRFYEIPLEVLNQFVSDREARKNARKEEDGEAEFKALQLNRVETLADGSMLVVGEQKYTITYYTTSQGMTRAQTTYHLDNLLVAKVSANGELAWMKKIPKKQTSSNPSGFKNLAYRYFLGTQNHYILFLDNAKNEKLLPNEKPVSHVDGQGGFMTIYQINDKTGELNRKSLLDTRDVMGMELYQVAPYRVLATEPNRLVFEAYKKGKEDILVKVELDK